MNFNILRFLDLSAEKLFWLSLFCSILFGLPMLILDSALETPGVLGFLAEAFKRLRL